MVNKVVYATPIGQKIGDCFMFLFRVLIGTPALAFLYLALVVVSWIIFSSPGHIMPEQIQKILLTVYLIALALALPTILRIAFRELRWRVEIHADNLLIGWPYFSKQVSYNDVRLLRIGTLSERLEGKDARPRNLPVLLEYSSHGKFRIWLETEEAERLFKSLLERCPHAAAVDRDGTQYAPRLDRQGKGMSRLSRERVIWGGGNLFAGILILIIALLAGSSNMGSDFAHVRRELMRLLAVFWSLKQIGFGLSVLLQRPQRRKMNAGESV